MTSADLTRAMLLRQIQEAQQFVEALRKAFPSCFDKDGRAIVAVARFPSLPRSKA